MITLDAGNATVLQEDQEGAPPAGPISWVNYSQNHTIAASVTIDKPAGAQEHDLLIAHLNMENLGDCTPPAGWTLIRSDVDGGNKRQWLFWHLVGSGDPGPYQFTWAAGGVVAGHISCFHGVDQTTPVEAQSGQSGQSVNPITPSITTLTANAWLEQFIGTQSDVTCAPPGSMTERYDMFVAGRGDAMEAATELFPAPGPTGTRTSTITLDRKWHAAIVAIREGGAVAQGNYYRWQDSSGISQGWAYYKDQVPGPATIRQGGPIGGYWIEARFPITLGGTLALPHVRIDVWNYAQTIHDQYEWSLDVPPDIFAWPCNYLQPPDPGGWPGGTPPDPYSCPTDTLASIAAALCTMRRTQAAMYGYILNINTLLAALYGPWAGTVGQAQEDASGHLGEFLQQALRAMSNYYPVATTEVLQDSAVTGDYELDLGADGFGPHQVGFRIELTSIPVYAGHREGVPILYEVNTRAEQLGWYEWELADGLESFTRLVWGVQYARKPAGPAEKFHMHLRAGVVADVYAITEYLQPKLTP